MSTNEREILRRLSALEDRVQSLNIIERPDNTGGWTPSLVGTLTAGTFTYTVRVGFYTRVGNLVSFFGSIFLSAINVAPTGPVVITGLPYTPQNTTELYGYATMSYVHNFNYTAGAIALHGRINPNLPYIYLSESFDTGGAVDIPPATLTATTYLIFGGSYLM